MLCPSRRHQRNRGVSVRWPCKKQIAESTVGLARTQRETKRFAFHASCLKKLAKATSKQKRDDDSYQGESAVRRGGWQGSCCARQCIPFSLAMAMDVRLDPVTLGPLHTSEMSQCVLRGEERRTRTRLSKPLL